jgi:hypothetical protein
MDTGCEPRRPCNLKEGCKAPAPDNERAGIEALARKRLAEIGKPFCLNDTPVDQPAFSRSDSERSRRSTISFVISRSRTRLLLGR